MEGQCEQYCKLDNIVLSKKAVKAVNMNTVIDDKVLVIDTKDLSIRFVHDLDEIRSDKDIQEVRNKIIKWININ